MVVLGLIACSTGTGEAMLEDRTWTLKSYGEPGSPKGVLADTEITVEFVSRENSVKGNAGCNSYFGSYELRRSQLSIPGPMAVTEMFCMEPTGVMDQEQEYLTILHMAEEYEISGDELTIHCGRQVLRFTSTVQVENR
jgi:heat shock protein HslJ